MTDLPKVLPPSIAVWGPSFQGTFSHSTAVYPHDSVFLDPRM